LGNAAVQLTQPAPQRQSQHQSAVIYGISFLRTKIVQQGAGTT